MRIVSLLPSTTEILFAIGAGSDVVGVTFECDYPAAARSRTIVSTSSMPTGLTPSQIDAYVSAALRRGEDLYHLDGGALAELDADLVITQNLCAVCAVDVSTVDDALSYLGCRADIVTIDPHTLADVFSSILEIGVATGHATAAAELVTAQRARLATVGTRVAGQPRPRVLLLEWTDPPFTPGHWVPEMITAAGGDPLLGAAGAASRRTTWEAIRASRPELIVLAPCGYDRPAAQALADGLERSGKLPGGIPVIAVDANASWARPGTRLIDGIEELAGHLHPDPAAKSPSLLESSSSAAD
jgi:iron complex transport system substrate-binding protein